MIETARLILRPPAEGDIPAIAAGLADFQVSRNTGRIPYPYTEADARDFLAWAAGLPSRSSTLAVEPKSRPGVIGIFSYQVTKDDPVPELGYWLAAAHWGQGYGREAAAALTRQAFLGDGHLSMQASVHKGNEASHRILTGLGFAFVREGMSLSKAQGQEVETIFLRLTREDWEARQTAPI